MSKSLAVKYRPTTFDDVTEQRSIKIILTQQLKAEEVRNAYLFCGPAGCGKTTCARIFASEINKGNGNPIELDAASNNGVDDVREIIQQAKTKSLDSEYKIFIIDECHALSNSAWQAMLKIIEEPPAKSIFIFCTTDPQKIPKTIISRVQRYDFQRISQQGIASRLWSIMDAEGYNDMDKLVPMEPLNYIAKIADGGMRDAITLLEKCLAYSSDLTIENIVKAIGTVDYDVMFDITKSLMSFDEPKVMETIEQLHADGKDIKKFINQYIQFILDILKWGVGCDWKYLQIPDIGEYRTDVKEICTYYFSDCKRLLNMLIKLNADIKYSFTPKYDLEAVLMLFLLK